MVGGGFGCWVRVGTFRLVWVWLCLFNLGLGLGLLVWVGTCGLLILVGWWLCGWGLVRFVVVGGLGRLGWWFLVGKGGGWLGCELNLAMN